MNNGAAKSHPKANMSKRVSKSLQGGQVQRYQGSTDAYENATLLVLASTARNSDTLWLQRTQNISLPFLSIIYV